MAASWLWTVMLAQTLTLWENEYLDRVCNQHAVVCLVAMWTDCVPKSGVLCIAQRSKWLHHAGVCRAKRK